MTPEEIARDAHCGYPSPRMMASDLYDKGYRERSDVAREIFAEIEDLLREWFDHFRQGGDIRGACVIMSALSQVAELKKKYTEVNDDKTDNHT